MLRCWLDGCHTVYYTTGRTLVSMGRDEKLRRVIQKQQRMRTEEPYLGIRRHLESGRGVGTLPPDLRFRKLLNDAA